jgi:hypothetical protein
VGKLKFWLPYGYMMPIKKSLVVSLFFAMNLLSFAPKNKKIVHEISPWISQQMGEWMNVLDRNGRNTLRKSRFFCSVF